MATGLKIWDASGAVVFDIDDYPLRYVGTLNLTRGMNGTFAIPNGAAGNEPWINPQFYNATFSAPAEVLLYLTGSVLNYNCVNLKSGVTLLVDYGWK